MTPVEFTGILTDLIDENKALFLVGFPLVASIALGITYVKRYFGRVKKLG